MKPTLQIEQDLKGHQFYYIYWQCEDDAGGTLGQSKSDGLGAAPKDPDDWEHWAACKAVMEAPERKYTRDTDGFKWESIKDARAALRLAKAALAAKKPLPEWAKTAIQNGWKAPKGWKP